MTDPTTPTEQPEAAEAPVQRPRRGAAIAIAGVQVAAAVGLIAVLLLGGRGQSDPAPTADVPPEPSLSAPVDPVEEPVDDVLDESCEQTEPVYNPVDPAALPEPALTGDTDDEQVDPVALGTLAREMAAWICSYPDADAVGRLEVGRAGVELLVDQQQIAARSLAELGYPEEPRALTAPYRHMFTLFAYRTSGGLQLDLSPRDGVAVTALVPATRACH
jgi:hypothetical protein